MRCSPAPSRCSSSAGYRGCRCRSNWLTRRPGTGGSCRWPRSRCPAPSCSPSPAMPGGSSRRWSPAILISAARTPWRSSLTGRSAKTVSEFKTKVITRGTEVTINAFYKHSRIKQYLKDGRALRIETVINAPWDLRVLRRLRNLGELQAKARAINARLLQTERVGQGCHLANPVFERIAHPTVTAEGRRASALRFGDSRAQALAGALSVTLCAVTGITSRSLRALMTGLLGAPYSMAQAGYDLALVATTASSPPPPLQHLPPDQRRPALRDLLHQSPQPRPGPAVHRRPAPGTTPAPRRPAHHDHLADYVARTRLPSAA